MSYASLLSGAAKTAQSILASMADEASDGIFTLSGTSYTGVMHLHRSELVPGPGGLTRVEQLDIVATADQFETAPTAVPRKEMVALGRNWFLVSVVPGAGSYALTCVPR